MPTTIITGASSGLGAEMARQLAARGWDLGLAARRLDRLEELRDEIVGRTGRRVEVRALDVTDDDQVFAVFRAFKEDFGTIDRVVVNAGLGKGAPLGTGRYDANKQTAMTNFVAALAQTEAAMEIFREQGAGHLVMISSMSAVRGMPKTLTTYAATKAGVAHLAEGLRDELHGTPIKVIIGYRSYQKQQDLYAKRTDELGASEAGSRVARPGHSEHQLGTTLDITSEGLTDVDQSWGATPTGQWIASHAHEYGFILSYPAEASGSTCYDYEPWHLRYVGRDEAADVIRQRVTLRQYLWDLEQGATALPSTSSTASTSTTAGGD